jgi:putative oxidoreductase
MATAVSSSSSSLAPSKATHFALWVVQILLALFFGMVGAMKLTQPIDVLAANMRWPGDVPALLVRFIGLCELLAAIGLLLPAATRIKPALTPLAALGLVTVMALAVLFHCVRGEFGALPVLIVLGGLAAFVAWGRIRKAPIVPR